MRVLDEWLHYVDTQEVLPLFERGEREYTTQRLKDVDWGMIDPDVARVLDDRDNSGLGQIASVSIIAEALRLLLNSNEPDRFRNMFANLLDLDSAGRTAVDGLSLTRCLLELLPEVPYLTVIFFRSKSWLSHKEQLEDDLAHVAIFLLKSLILVNHSFQSFVRDPFRLVLRDTKQLSIQMLAELIELIALTVKDPETALDLLIDCVEPETSRLLVGRPLANQQFVKSVIGIALDYIDEVSGNKNVSQESIQLLLDGSNEGFGAVKARIRIDSSMQQMRVGDHVRLRATRPPQNAPAEQPYAMDAMVIKAELGEARLRCLQKIPQYVEDCDWTVAHYGSFVTSKAMFDALVGFYGSKAESCRLYALLVGHNETSQEKERTLLSHERSHNLNESQNKSLEASMSHELCFLWGPPGTGKTQTIVVILEQLLKALPKERFLVTAPTHNAVDNMLQRFVDKGCHKRAGVLPLRVSTTVSYGWAHQDVLHATQIIV
jgi:hypothetical protein